MAAVIVRTVRAFEGETVEIRWQLKDGGDFYQRIVIPPKDVRAARTADQPVKPTFPPNRVITEGQEPS